MPRSVAASSCDPVRIDHLEPVHNVHVLAVSVVQSASLAAAIIIVDVELVTLGEYQPGDMRFDDAARLHALITRHAHYTNSAKPQMILKDFAAYLPKFRKVMPSEYKRALADMAKVAEAAE